MNKKIKITKGSVQETLIIPLYARKMCCERFPSLYYDAAAIKACNSLDYDFSDLNKKSKSVFYEFGALEGAMRQLDVMWEINDYLKSHKKASIVCLGCGLDIDPRRCGTKDNKIYNIDFKETINAREELVGKDDREINIATNINDLNWLDTIDNSNGTILYAAGVFHYFKKEEVKSLAIKIAEKLPGSRLIFDVVNDFGYKMMLKTVLKSYDMQDINAYFKTNDPKEFETWTNKIKVSSRKYMRGYYDMKNKEVRSIHRILADVADKMLGMTIVRFDYD